MSSPAPTLPFSLAANPRLSSWIRFTSDGQVTVSPGKVEIGQGIVTALAQIAADELDVDIGRVQMVRATTAASPNEGVTSGSLSIQHSGRALRVACAEIRQIFLAAAVDRLGVDAGALAIDDGTISGPGNVRTSYWELADEVSARPRRDAGRAAETDCGARACRPTGAAHRHSRQGVCATAFHTRHSVARAVAWPGAAARQIRTQGWLH